MKTLERKTRAAYEQGLLDLTSKGLITVVQNTPFFTKIETRNTTLLLSFDKRNNPFHIGGQSFDVNGLENYILETSNKRDTFDMLVKELEAQGHLTIIHSAKEFVHVVVGRSQKHVTLWFNTDGPLCSIDANKYSGTQLREKLVG